MKFLLIPEFKLAAGTYSPRQCAQCGNCRAHVQITPGWKLAAGPYITGPVVVMSRKHASLNGLTYCQPAASWLPVILGYRDHRAAVPATTVYVVARELEADRPISDMLIARVRDFFGGVKTEYSILGQVAPAEEYETEAACPPCRHRLIEQAAIAWQGRLTVAPGEAIDERYVPHEEGAQFFNHKIEVTSGRFTVARTLGFLSLYEEGGHATIVSPDHPAETIELGPGRYWLSHPWPRQNGRD